MPKGIPIDDPFSARSRNGLPTSSANEPTKAPERFGSDRTYSGERRPIQRNSREDTDGINQETWSRSGSIEDSRSRGTQDSSSRRYDADSQRTYSRSSPKIPAGSVEEYPRRNNTNSEDVYGRAAWRLDTPDSMDSRSDYQTNSGSFHRGRSDEQRPDLQDRRNSQVSEVIPVAPKRSGKTSSLVEDFYKIVDDNDNTKIEGFLTIFNSLLIETSDASLVEKKMEKRASQMTKKIGTQLGSSNLLIGIISKIGNVAFQTCETLQHFHDVMKPSLPVLNVLVETNKDRKGYSTWFLMSVVKFSFELPDSVPLSKKLLLVEGLCFSLMMNGLVSEEQISAFSKNQYLWSATILRHFNLVSEYMQPMCGWIHERAVMREAEQWSDSESESDSDDSSHDDAGESTKESQSQSATDD